MFVVGGGPATMSKLKLFQILSHGRCTVCLSTLENLFFHVNACSQAERDIRILADDREGDECKEIQRLKYPDSVNTNIINT